MVPTPQSLVSEGIAELAPRMVLESDGGAALGALVRDAGIELDLAHALAVQRAGEPCRGGWAEVNAALLLYDRGASEAEVVAYLERWGLSTPEQAAHVLRFLTEPTSRTYVLTYPAGRELCRSYVAGEPERFRRLLIEQVRVRDLLEAGGSFVPGPHGEYTGLIADPRAVPLRCAAAPARPPLPPRRERLSGRRALSTGRCRGAVREE
jgi:hypothetical protein